MIIWIWSKSNSGRSYLRILKLSLHWIKPLMQQAGILTPIQYLLFAWLMVIIDVDVRLWGGSIGEQARNQLLIFFYFIVSYTLEHDVCAARRFGSSYNGRFDVWRNTKTDVGENWLHFTLKAWSSFSWKNISKWGKKTSNTWNRFFFEVNCILLQPHNILSKNPH